MIAVARTGVRLTTVTAIVALAAVLSGCSKQKGADIDASTQPTSTAHSPTPSAGSSGLAASLGPHLTGRWCTTAAPRDCFDAADVERRFPEAFVYGIDADTAHGGATVYTICLESDLPTGCSIAATTYLEYLPRGVAWNCASDVATAGFKGCEPDHSSEQDTSRPRLLRLDNHQQDAAYHDSPPMYRRG